MRKTCLEWHFMTYFLFTGIFLVASLTVPAETAGEIEDWGNAPGLTEPHPDSKGRAGYWWWPRPTTKEADQAGIGGNRGRVFGSWEPTEQVAALVSAPPCPEPLSREPERLLILKAILFPFDSSELTVEAKAEIDRTILGLEWFFKQYMNARIVCVGRTDDVGSIEYNQRLGERRAQIVRDALVRGGAAKERISTKSVGETQPVVPNDSRVNRALNRRVDFEIILGTGVSMPW